MMMTSLNGVITDFFEVRFLHYRLKNPQFGQITQIQVTNIES